MAKYGSKEYWELEHEGKCGREQEWYGEFDQVFEILALYMKVDGNKKERILHLGCGTSRLAEGLWKKGWTNIVNVDSSSIAIEQMKARDSHLHGVEYRCTDATDLSEFPESSFDYIIDKGFLDAVFSSLGSIRKASQALDHISRILKPGGYYISFSAAPKDCRFPHLIRPRFDWSVDTVRVPLSIGYYAYACNKRSYGKEWFFGGAGALHCAQDAKKIYKSPVRLRR